MISHFMLSKSVAVACAVTGATAIMADVCSAQTLTAADYATNSAYADGWQETDNGGFGFSSWSFAGTYTSAIQHAMDNTSPYNQLGLAWTLFLPVGANAGTVNPPPPPPPPTDLSRAGRGFPALQPGQTLTTVFDNPTERFFYKGYTICLVSGGQNVGYCCPGAVARLRVGTFDYFTYGRWYIDDASGSTTSLYDTNTAAAGASLAFTLTSPNTYKLVFTPLGNPSLASTNSGTLNKGGAIDWIMFEHYNTDSDFFDDAGPHVVTPAYETDFYIRSITITDVQPIAPEIVQRPLSQTLYSGRTARFTVEAKGTLLSYRWRKDGSDLANGGNISGALTDTLIVSNVSAGDIGAYTVVLANSVGAVTSSPPANLTVVQPSGPYESAVVAAHPVAYWRLNETENPTNNPAASDYWNGLFGIYGSAAQNGFNGIAGPPSTTFPGLGPNNKAVQSTAATDQSWVTVPALNLNTNTLTFTLWLCPNSASIADYAGVLYTRRGTTTAAGVQYTTDNQIGYTINNDPYTWQFFSDLRPPASQWSFVAVVVEPNEARLYLYNTNGLASATNYNNPHENVAWDGIGYIGADADHSLGRTFDGKIDEVAVFNHSFTPQQVLDLYNAALTAPPPSVTLAITNLGSTVRLTWPQGTLLEANQLTGLWTTNGASSPYTFSPAGAKKFFRVRVQ